MNHQTLLSNTFLQEIVEYSEHNTEGKVASYIPELANVEEETTSIAVLPVDGNCCYTYSNQPPIYTTLQSAGKLIPLIGLLEELGTEQLMQWVTVEPSGDDFASISRLERFGPLPSNPMLNAGAIALCSRIPGIAEQQFAWLEKWTQKLFNQKLNVNTLVFASEKRTGDHNRALAYLLKSRDNLGSNVRDTLEIYFTLCSYEATIEQAVYLPTLLANEGVDPLTGERILSKETCHITISIMATCGLYDESGTHLVRTGLPAKSGVSGYILAVAPGKAGIAVLSPRVNEKGNSIRGGIMLEQLTKRLNWHFASQ